MFYVLCFMFYVLFFIFYFLFFIFYFLFFIFLFFSFSSLFIILPHGWITLFPIGKICNSGCHCYYPLNQLLFFQRFHLLLEIYAGHCKMNVIFLFFITFIDFLD